MPYSRFSDGGPSTEGPQDAASRQFYQDNLDKWRNAHPDATSDKGYADTYGSSDQFLKHDQSNGTIRSNQGAGPASIGDRDAANGIVRDSGMSNDGGVTDALTNMGIAGTSAAGSNANWWQKYAGTNHGPSVVENQQLSNNESATRGGDEAGALQLQREAAMGYAPSQAAYQMQDGLNQSLAAQQAMQGSARGNAGIAMASANAASNGAALQNQTYNQAAALRAQEMATARGMYGGLAGDVRTRDQSRLGMATDVDKFNATDATNNRLGAGDLGAKYGNLGLGYYNGAVGANDAQNRINLGNRSLDVGNANTDADREQQRKIFNAGQNTELTRSIVSGAGTLLGTAMNAYTGGAGTAVGAAGRGLAGTRP